ncbi:NADPH-dependent FMN reductase [Weissella cibaria]|uniref:NADPH-dependent FMN reductase n=1 Tax=Weissella cibaria TaxID=137591 RepID=UPI001370CB1B|nr:NADPH-dependent FMN reductase [Weissella cibaria]MYV36752.1 NAD(P)H-dependent oxidoreductase [Weissella cibaria]
MNYVAIVGTNARKSYNRSLLWFMKKHFNAQANIEIVEIADLPLFSEDAETPVRIAEIARQIAASDGAIISTPEYDHSITAALKSFVEWMSYGDLHPFTNLPVMIVGASLGRQGTNNAQEHLRQIMDAPGIDAFVLPGNQFLVGPAATNIDIKTDDMTDARTISFLETIFQNFMVFAKSLQPMRAMAFDRTSGAMPTVAGEGVVESVKLGYANLEKVMPGSGLDVDAVPTIISPDVDATVVEQGAGWWIEKTTLTDDVVASQLVTAGADIDDDEEDATTGASMF